MRAWAAAGVAALLLAWPVGCTGPGLEPPGSSNGRINEPDTGAPDDVDSGNGAQGGMSGVAGGAGTGAATGGSGGVPPVGGGVGGAGGVEGPDDLQDAGVDDAGDGGDEDAGEDPLQLDP